MRKVLLALLALFALMSAPTVYADDASTDASAAALPDIAPDADVSTEALPPLVDPADAN